MAPFPTTEKKKLQFTIGGGGTTVQLEPESVERNTCEFPKFAAVMNTSRASPGAVSMRVIMTAGSVPYSTSIARTASAAWARVSATTAATGSPT